MYSKLFTLFALWLGLQGCVFALPVKLWDKTLGGSMMDYGSDICVRSIPNSDASDGSYLVGGVTGSDISGDKITVKKGFGFEWWLIKYSSNNVMQWQKDYAGGNDVMLKKIYATPDGGYLLGGDSYSDSLFDHTGTNYGELDYWVVKIDKDGNILWDKNLGGDDNDLFADLHLTPDGGCIVGGSSRSGKSGDKLEANKGTVAGPSYDMWIIKLNKDGKQEWQKTVGGGNDDTLGSIVVLSITDFLLTGTSGSDIGGDKTENCFGQKCDYWVVKMMVKNGIQPMIVWDKTYGGTGFDYLTDALSSPVDDSVVLFGYSFSQASGVKSQNTKGINNDADYWIVKIDPLTGQLLWDKDYGSLSQDWANNLEMCWDKSGYIVGGHSGGQIGGDKRENNKGILNDFWLLKVDLKGNKIWDKTYGGSNEDVYPFIVKTPDYRRYFILGSSYSPAGGDKTEPTRNPGFYYPDYWLIRFIDK